MDVFGLHAATFLRKWNNESKAFLESAPQLALVSKKRPKFLPIL